MNLVLGSVVKSNRPEDTHLPVGIITDIYAYQTLSPSVKVTRVYPKTGAISDKWYYPDDLEISTFNEDCVF